MRAVEGVGEAEERHRVLHRGETLGWRRADPLGGRVRRHQVRIPLLQLLELDHQGVVLGVADDRAVQDVIAVVVVVDLPSELFYPPGGCWIGHTRGPVSFCARV